MSDAVFTFVLGAVMWWFYLSLNEQIADLRKEHERLRKIVSDLESEVSRIDRATRPPVLAMYAGVDPGYSNDDD